MRAENEFGKDYVEVSDFPLASRQRLAYNIEEIGPGRVPQGNFIMRKSSPRLLAGIVVLGLFAVVGTLTFTAFTKNVREVPAPAGFG